MGDYLMRQVVCSQRNDIRNQLMQQQQRHLAKIEESSQSSKSYKIKKDERNLLWNSAAADIVLNISVVVDMSELLNYDAELVNALLNNFKETSVLWLAVAEQFLRSPFFSDIVLPSQQLYVQLRLENYFDLPRLPSSAVFGLNHFNTSLQTESDSRCRLVTFSGIVQSVSDVRPFSDRPLDKATSQLLLLISTSDVPSIGLTRRLLLVLITHELVGRFTNGQLVLGLGCPVIQFLPLGTAVDEVKSIVWFDSQLLSFESSVASPYRLEANTIHCVHDSLVIPNEVVYQSRLIWQSAFTRCAGGISSDQFFFEECCTIEWKVIDCILCSLAPHLLPSREFKLLKLACILSLVSCAARSASAMNILETTTSNNSAVSLDRYFEPYVAFMSCPHFPDSTDVSRRAVGYECAPVHLLVESDEPCIFRWMQWCHALHPRSATQPSISDTSMNTEGSIGTGGQSLTPCHSLLFVPLNMRSLKSKNQTELLRQLRGQSRCEPSSKHMGNTIDTTPLNLSIWMHSTTRNRTKVVGFRHDELSAECTFCLRVDPTPEQIEQMSSGLLEFHSASKTHFSLPIPEFSDTAKLGEFLQVARSLEVDMSDTVKHFIQTYFLAVRSNGYHMYVLRTLVRTHCDHLKRIVHITKAVARVLLHSECTHIDAAVAIMICEEFHTRKAGAEWSVLGFSESSMLNIDQHFNDLGSDPSQRMTSFCDRLYRIVKNAIM